jgi:hypothetical protein
MNKTAIKNFAVWARNKLIADITYRAGLMGITEDGIKSALPQSSKDVEFYDIGTKEPYSITGEAVRQRRKLAELIGQKAKSSDYKTAYRSVLEEVAYTWFNRLIAIRFMEVNDYLPSRIRVLSSESKSKLEPDLVTTPFDAELELTEAETETVMRLKTDNQVDDLFRLLFIKQCNALNKVLPQLFEKTADYSELLLNVSVTDQDGVVYHLVHDIDEDDFNIEKGGQVEIIGWLYQYYNTEPKDEAFALLKKNVKITKERIPAATQLFTPDWIVRYMVENSLGRLWLEGHPNEELKAEWKYYLNEAEQEEDVEAQLAKIREEYKTIQPEEIKVIDPCMGSGHILVYAFDVLMQIYEAAGYTQREAAKSILEHNLYGLDIDDRAFQLAYFAVMMKARQYNRRILNGEAVCHVYAIQESNTVNRNHLKYLGAGMNDFERNNALNQLTALLDTFVDAKEYGSILNVDTCDWDLLRRFVRQSSEGEQMSMDSFGLEDTKAQILLLIDIGQVMAQKYETCVTNPPYMGYANMNAFLVEFVKRNYPNTKSDMSTVYMQRCLAMTKKFGYMSMINIPVWMFIASYENLRKDIIENYCLVNMIHPGRGIFGSDFGTTSFVIQNTHIVDYLGCYRRLFDKNVEVKSVEEREDSFLRNKGKYYAKQQGYLNIPGYPIAYWVGKAVYEDFSTMPRLGIISPTKTGMTTGDNNRFLRIWYEVQSDKINHDYKFYCKGGPFRRWYGNIESIINWKAGGAEVKHFTGSTIRNEESYFKKCIVWNLITSGDFSARAVFDYSCVMGDAAPATHPIRNYDYILACLNTKPTQYLLNIMNPTINCSSGVLDALPVGVAKERVESVETISQKSQWLSKEDWDEFENSWNFVRHPLVCKAILIEDAFNTWSIACETRFNQLKVNEEELNRIFIDIYGLQDELTPEVEDKDVTVRKADLGRDIRSLLSYAVGCMFGRYSLDVPGLAYAGGEWDDSKYSSFIPDKDNILPITDEEYFEDDIVGLFCAWLKKVYGADTLEQNLDFIAKALGGKGNTSREVIRNYFLNEFFKDHCQTYSVTGSGKRPIYWLFDSGKQNGFKALVYMHRYDENTIGNLRIDYLHRMERVYDNEIARMQDIIDNSTVAREVTQATKRREKLQKQLKECKEYDERIAHLALARIPIDLDDGVKVNYEKVQTVDGVKYPVLAKI